jgi:MFS family permease
MNSSGETGSAEHFNARYVWLISIVAALGGLLFGYDWVVIGGAKPLYEKYFQLHTGQMVGWANSCALLGCLLGSPLAGGLSARAGRRRAGADRRMDPVEAGDARRRAARGGR